VSHGFGDPQFGNAKILHFVEIAEGLEGVESPYPWKVFWLVTTGMPPNAVIAGLRFDALE